MTKAEKDKYWMDCIQQCRVSGMSDYTWCNQNGISLSSFYYNIRRLRDKACIPDSVAKAVEKQEVVPIQYNELPETKIDIPKKQTDLAVIRLEYNGVIVAISNDADATIIKATLMALQQLC
ncbi:IS66 family insertion sequence element accessory protein TnpA [uncultured Robinsoniella sp.]|uniref:IS66 family insertion sequence element accessory protein TnpA n=1 Tax=uncultured Robinsoniella sp. TaxID=904190 RepID=UPI00374E8A2C